MSPAPATTPVFVYDLRSKYKHRYWIVTVVFCIAPLVAAFFDIGIAIVVFGVFTLPSLAGAVWSLLRAKRIEFYEDKIMFLQRRTVWAIPYSQLTLEPIPMSEETSRSFKLISSLHSFSTTLPNVRIPTKDNIRLHNFLYEKMSGMQVATPASLVSTIQGTAPLLFRLLQQLWIRFIAQYYVLILLASILGLLGWEWAIIASPSTSLSLILAVVGYGILGGVFVLTLVIMALLLIANSMRSQQQLQQQLSLRGTFCQACGSPANEGSRFCYHCGAQLGTASSQRRWP